MLWRAKVEPTPFKIYTADPVTGQVALQTRLLIEGRNALVGVRLKLDRGEISEIVHDGTRRGAPTRLPGC